MEQDNEPLSFVTIAAATAKLLTKEEQPNSDGEARQGERTSETEQRKEKRTTFKVG